LLLSSMPKGKKLTEAQKKAMQEGRKASRKAKEALSPVEGEIHALAPSQKPIMRYSGKEEDFLDFYPALRAALTSAKRSKLFDEIALQIVRANKDVEKIKTILKEYVTLKKEGIA
jgi:hypothetical protein